MEKTLTVARRFYLRAFRYVRYDCPAYPYSWFIGTIRRAPIFFAPSLFLLHYVGIQGTMRAKHVPQPFPL